MQLAAGVSLAGLLPGQLFAGEALDAGKASIGYPLSELIKQVEPTGNAKFIELTTLYDPIQMPGQSSSVLQWPLVEGLRIDEAMYPIT